MTNPYDPNTPLYEGQALRHQQAQAQPQQAQTPQQPNGFHLLEGVGNLVMAAAHFLSSGGGDDDEGDEEEQRPARRVRPRVFGARPSRVGAGSCCKRPTR